jgi:hypothetical protein
MKGVEGCEGECRDREPGGEEEGEEMGSSGAGSTRTFPVVVSGEMGLNV